MPHFVPGGEYGGGGGEGWGREWECLQLTDVQKEHHLSALGREGGMQCEYHL